jgi:hypothetical protein
LAPGALGAAACGLAADEVVVAGEAPAELDVVPDEPPQAARPTLDSDRAVRQMAVQGRWRLAILDM